MNMQNQRKRSYDCNDGNSELNTEDIYLYQINHTGEPCHKLHGVKVLKRYIYIFNYPFRNERPFEISNLSIYVSGRYNSGKSPKHLYCRVCE